MVAFPRPHVWSRGPAGTRPLDRVEMLVDLELGILLRHEEILDGRTLSVTELTGVRLDPDPADDDRFAPPGGWDSARRSLSWAPRGPGWEAAKLFTGLAAGGIGALVRSSRSRPFEQATQEEPEAEMPPDPEPLPADAPAVTDQVLHLLHDSRGRWATGITATLNQWHDMAAILAQVPDGARRVGFGGLGYLIDAAGERMATLHMVSRLSFDGSGRYRIEPALAAEGSSRHRGETVVSDGKRQWQLIGGEMVAMPGGPPHEIAKLLDASWLLEHRLSGGAETSVGGRRGYRLRVAANGPIAGQMFATDEVVADAELGILLRMVCHAGSTPVSRFELRDVGWAVISASTSRRARRPRRDRTTIRPARAAIRRGWPACSPGRRPGRRVRRSGASSATASAQVAEVLGSPPYRSCHRRRRNASLLPSLNWTALNSSLSGSCPGIGQRFAQLQCLEHAPVDRFQPPAGAEFVTVISQDIRYQQADWPGDQARRIQCGPYVWMLDAASEGCRKGLRVRDPRNEYCRSCES